MEDWILEGSKSITLLSQKYIIGSAAIIEDRLSLRFKKDITTMRDSL